MEHPQILKSHYPWTATPLICSAPMRLIATAELATTVSRASGLGFLSVGTDVSSLSPLLSDAEKSFKLNPLGNTPPGILPIGVGFICWGVDLAVVISVLEEKPLKPAAVWLFATEDDRDLESWAVGIRKATANKTRIWIQVGTVEAARTAAALCNPDVLIIQGSDAGGHGLVKSASLITLLPESSDALKRAGHNIPLIAAGGIADWRGVAASLALGASGACLGTRLLATPEAVITDGYRNAVIEAVDGGVSTARTCVYDMLRGTTGWPARYDGRGVLNQSIKDCEEGMSDEENKKLYEQAMKLGDGGWGPQGRMTTYAGSCVGLVNTILPAATIVSDILANLNESMGKLKSKL